MRTDFRAPGHQMSDTRVAWPAGTAECRSLVAMWTACMEGGTMSS
jgi:hypothetical protein